MSQRTPRPALSGDVPELLRSGGWRDRAACSRYDAEEWFPDKDWESRNATNAEALAVCWLHCPVRRDCLRYALAIEGRRTTRFGIWGGYTAPDRLRLQRRIDALGLLEVEL